MRRNLLIFLSLSLVFSSTTLAQQKARDGGSFEYPEWKTNTAKRSINLQELISPGVTRDGIPSIDAPRFVAVKTARTFLSDNEPVIVLRAGGLTRAYPLQILLWHEIVNDQLAGLPVLITYCSICNSAIVFERKLGTRVLSFGVTGFVHGSNMIFYDRQTESWWQQFTGEAVVGDLTGKKLRRLPAQMISFGQFASAFPKAQVLSQQTGFQRDYGRNPHFRYDTIDGRPSHFRGKPDPRLKPMERVIGVEIGNLAKAYPYSISRTRRVIYDRLGAQELVIFHAPGTISVLDEADIRRSKEVGSTGVFDPRVGDQTLHFRYKGETFIDSETGSQWNILGQAISGTLRGKSLRPINSGDYFAFAWIAFKPQTEIFTD
jgi:hypothetical protein